MDQENESTFEENVTFNSDPFTIEDENTGYENIATENLALPEIPSTSSNENASIIKSNIPIFA